MTYANGNALIGELERTTAAWPTASSATVSQWAKEKLRAAAEVQSRRMLATAKAELANRAAERFITLAYDGSESGHWFNVDSTGRLIVPTPWSRAQHARYGLSDPAARLLRIHITDVIDALPARRRLLLFDGARWHLNRGTFGSLAAGLEWWRTAGAITAERWDALSQRYPHGRK